LAFNPEGAESAEGLSLYERWVRRVKIQDRAG
jgi:hypothetical protein